MLVAEGSTPQLRILVVGEREVARGGLRSLLSRTPWVVSCAAVASAEEALQLVRLASFDVALVDVAAGPAYERLRAAATGVRVGAIAMDQPPRTLLRAVRDAAAGRACEPAARELRFAAREKEILRLAAAGKTNAEIGATMFLAPGTIKHHLIELFVKLGAPNRAAAVHTARRLGVLSGEDEAGPEPSPVSPRERDVLAAFARGATNHAAARSLGLSPHTVKQHASSVYRKLGVRNRAEAVHRADELGLL